MHEHEHALEMRTAIGRSVGRHAQIMPVDISTSDQPTMAAMLEDRCIGLSSLRENTTSRAIDVTMTLSKPISTAQETSLRQTYQIPSPKISVKKTFSVRRSCSFQICGIGSTNNITSPSIVSTEFAIAPVLRLAQWPGIDASQRFCTGQHVKIKSKNTVTHQHTRNAPIAHTHRRKWRATSKMRSCMSSALSFVSERLDTYIMSLASSSLLGVTICAAGTVLLAGMLRTLFSRAMLSSSAARLHASEKRISQSSHQKRCLMRYREAKRRERKDVVMQARQAMEEVLAMSILMGLQLTLTSKCN